MTQHSPLEIAQRFYTHLGDHDVEALLALAHDDIVVGGPRGTGAGVELLREWVARANVAMTPKRWFATDDVVVVEQEAVWTNQHGDETGRRIVTTTFRIRDGKIAAIYRHDDLAAALTIAGLDADDEAHPTPTS